MTLNRTRAHPTALARRLRRGMVPLRAAAVAAAVTSLVAVGFSTPAPPQDLGSPERLRMVSATSMTSGTYERRVQVLVNARRANHGLSRVRLAACPDGTAERWSRYLAVNDAFYHQSMTSVLEKCNARYAGETLGRGTMAPRRLVRMWIQSPGHRDILLSRKARRIGIGATRNVLGQWVVAANFVRY